MNLKSSLLTLNFGHKGQSGVWAQTCRVWMLYQSKLIKKKFLWSFKGMYFRYQVLLSLPAHSLLSKCCMWQTNMLSSQEVYSSSCSLVLRLLFRLLLCLIFLLLCMCFLLMIIIFCYYIYFYSNSCFSMFTLILCYALAIFTELAPLGRFSQRVAMSVCLWFFPSFFKNLP